MEFFILMNGVNKTNWNYISSFGRIDVFFGAPLIGANDFKQLIKIINTLLLRDWVDWFQNYIISIKKMHV